MTLLRVQEVHRQRHPGSHPGVLGAMLSGMTRVCWLPFRWLWIVLHLFQWQLTLCRHDALTKILHSTAKCCSSHTIHRRSNCFK
jgi:hypothetical protein